MMEDEEMEPRKLTTTLEKLKEDIKECNLCIDTLAVTLPDSKE